MPDSWLRKKAEELQCFEGNIGMKMFHDALKSSGTTLMTDKVELAYIQKGNAQVCDSHRGISLLYCLLPGRYWPNSTDSPA